jgi:hypothetical protein
MNDMPKNFFPFRIINIRQTIFLMAFYFLCLQNLSASHLMGVEMYYDCVGANQYRISLVIYRDCQGLTPGVTQNVSINRCGTPSTQSLSLVSGFPQDVSNLCPTTLSNCSGGSFNGVDKWVYQAVVTFPAGCNNIKVSYSHCCWLGTIVNLSNPSSQSIFTEMIIDNTLSACNNSSRFQNNPNLSACNNQPFQYSFAANDADADSLVYALVNCQTGSGTSASYNVPFSGTNPLSATGLSFDTRTGQLSFTPTAVQTAVLCVRVDEYRNGVKIAEQTRVALVQVLNCTNSLPRLSALNLAGTAQQANYDYNFCVSNNPVCFDMIAYDANAADSVFATWNNSIAGATFTTQRISNDSVRATFCFTPSSAGLKTFTVKVNDNACPKIGQNIYTYKLNVGGLLVNVQNASTSCAGSSDASLAATVSGGTAPYSYIWPTGHTTATLNGIGAGTYCVTATDAVGCSGVACATVTQPSLLTASISQTNVSCNGGMNGSAIATASGGTAPYSFLWSNGRTTATNTGLFTNTYSCTFTDANGCTEIRSVTITEPSAITASITSTNASCNGQSNGTATISISGGANPYSFSWSNGNTSASNTGLSAGTYTVTATDANACSVTRSATITQLNAISITSSSTPQSCIPNTGTASVTTSGGTGALSYAWNTGAITNNINSLNAGTYTVTVTDAILCTATATVTVGNSNLGATTNNANVSCNGGNNGSMTILPNGGTAPYLFIWSNGQTTTNNTMTGLSAAVSCVTVVDANNCSAINCATITEPSQITVSLNSQQMSCAMNDASVSVVVTGGTPAYSFLWSGPNNFQATTANLSSIANGSYQLNVTDANGCLASETTVIDSFIMSYFNQDLLVSDDSTLNLTVTVPTASSAQYLVQNPQNGTLSYQNGGSYEYVPTSAAQVFDTITVRHCNATEAYETNIIVGISSCVWAGDSDTNQLVNNFDLLPIGLNYGSADNPRPNAGTDWDCEPMTDWTNVSGQPNPKHADTNGDGFIDDNDTLAIALNWGSFYLRSLTNSNGAVPLYLDTATVAPGDTVRLDVLLGNALQNATNVYGIAFTVNYDNSIVDTNSVRMKYDNSWLGTKDLDMLAMSKDFYPQSRTEVALVRTDHTGRSNSGAIAHIQFTIKDDVLKSTNLRLNLSISNVRMIDSAAVELPVSPLPSSVLILPTPTSVNSFENDNEVIIFPNPATDLITVSSLYPIDDMKIISIDSKEIQLDKSQNTINVSSLSPGLYCLLIESNGKQIIKKFVKK